MSQISRRPIRKDTEEKILSLFWETVASCNSKPLVAELLEDLLTPTENVMLAKRLAIAYLLLKGYPYDVITSTLKVSTPTIGTVSLMLKIKGNGLRKSLETIVKQRRRQEFFHYLTDVALDVLGHAKGNDWRRAERYKYQRRREKHAPLS